MVQFSRKDAKTQSFFAAEGHGLGNREAIGGEAGLVNKICEAGNCD
jgi:hypothetical protein